jgi:hypothetical protein
MILKKAATKELCKNKVDILTQFEFEVIYRDNADILLQDESNKELAMIYDSIDLGQFSSL